MADAVVPGLKVRVTDRGARAFILWRRSVERPSPTRSLGKVGAITPAKAKDKARDWLGLPSLMSLHHQVAARWRRNSFCRQALPQVCASRRRCVNISLQTTQATVASCANNRQYQRCFFYRAGYLSSQRFRSRHLSSVMEHLFSHFCLS